MFLEFRRQVSRLSLFHKIYLHNELKHALIAQPPCSLSCIDHPYKVNVISCETSALFHSFRPRTLTEWNLLPPAIALILDRDSFRPSLARYLETDVCHSFFLQPFILFSGRSMYVRSICSYCSSDFVTLFIIIVYSLFQMILLYHIFCFLLCF